MIKETYASPYFNTGSDKSAEVPMCRGAVAFASQKTNTSVPLEGFVALFSAKPGSVFEPVN